MLQCTSDLCECEVLHLVILLVSISNHYVDIQRDSYVCMDWLYMCDHSYSVLLNPLLLLEYIYIQI